MRYVVPAVRLILPSVSFDTTHQPSLCIITRTLYHTKLTAIHLTYFAETGCTARLRKKSASRRVRIGSRFFPETKQANECRRCHKRAPSHSAALHLNSSRIHVFEPFSRWFAQFGLGGGSSVYTVCQSPSLTPRECPACDALQDASISYTLHGGGAGRRPNGIRALNSLPSRSMIVGCCCCFCWGGRSVAEPRREQCWGRVRTRIRTGKTRALTTPGGGAHRKGFLVCACYALGRGGGSHVIQATWLPGQIRFRCYDNIFIWRVFACRPRRLDRPMDSGPMDWEARGITDGARGVTDEARGVTEGARGVAEVVTIVDDSDEEPSQHPNESRSNSSAVCLAHLFVHIT